MADRDIAAEVENNKIDIGSNGDGFSNAVWMILNDNAYDRDLIEIVLLNELNMIFSPDANFTRILSERVGSGKSEIFLEESAKGRVALSQMGSGVKTILLVLGFLYIIPKIDESRADISKTIFLFEELENNLHPSIQKRLFEYLRKFAEEKNSTIVVTTHSNVVIDLFSNRENAQIIHVTHDGQNATATKVDTWSAGRNVLDDMGIHASDLLQSNAIVWVEGPSDRIYFRRWMDLWSEGALREGVHYQCLPFGGSCNSHYSFDDPDVVEEVLSAMRVNRNAILLIDSDRSKEGDELKLHTSRLKNEVRKHCGHCWITDGKEVENYLPISALRLYLADDQLKGPGRYKNMLDYIKQKKKHLNPPRKTVLAQEISTHFTREMLEETLDMSDQLETIMNRIKVWNGMQ